MTDPENNIRFKLVDYINLFFNFKKIILINSVIVGLITAIIVFFILDPIYISTGTIKTLGKSSGLSSLLSGSMPDLGELGDLAGGTSTTKELALFENILLSRRCIEETILKFNIIDEYSYKTMFDAVKGFKDNIMEINKDRLAGTIDIGTYDKDPQKAKEMTDFLILQLNKINIELNVQDAKNNREFIQSRLNLVQKDLRTYEDSMEQYQNKFGIAPDLKVQFASKVEIELEAEIKSEEVKLELLRKILSPEQSEVKAQINKIELLKGQLTEIQNSSSDSGNLNLKGSPKILLDYFRLKRELEIQNKIMTTLIPLLEQAKIEENRNTPSVLIIDPPNVPDRKVKPKRLTMVFVFSVLTFLLTYLACLFRVKWNYYKTQIKF